MVVLTARRRKLFATGVRGPTFLGVGQDGDEVDGLESWCRELGQFSSWPSKRMAG